MDDAGWSIKTIRELGLGRPSVVQTGPFGSQLHAEDYVEDGVPFILIKNIGDAGLKDGDIPRISFADAKRLNKYCLQAGDIVFSRVGRVGSCFLATDGEKGWVISGQTLRLRLENPAIDLHFLLYALRSHKVQDFVSKQSVGTTRESLNTGILYSIPVDHPSRSSQQKIVDILSTVEEAIEQTEALIAKTQQIKTGLMHDLFTRGVNPDGQLRPRREEAPQLYKESPLGWIPKEWSVDCLSNLGSFMNGLNLAKDQFGFGVKFVNILDVYQERLDIDGLGLMNASPSECARYGLNVGDIVLDRSSVKLEGVGYPTIFPQADEQVVFCGFIIRFRIAAEQLRESFALTVMRSAAFRRLVMQIATVSANVNVNQRALGRLPMVIPEADEQLRIEERLMRASQALENEKAEKEKLQQLKVGLMSDLLSGRVAVSSENRDEAAA